MSSQKEMRWRRFYGTEWLKQLFPNGAIPAAFKVTESEVTSKGVIVVNYERTGVGAPRAR